MKLLNPNMFKLKNFFSFYFLFWAIYATLTPYLGIFYTKNNFNGYQIGALGFVFFISSFLSIIILSQLSNRKRINQNKLTIIFSIIIIISFLFLFFNFIPKFEFIFIIIFLIGFSISPLNSVVDNQLLIDLGNKSHEYGKFRSFGPLGFAFGIFFSSFIVTKTEINFTFLLGSLFAVGMLVIFSRIKFSETENSTLKTTEKTLYLIKEKKLIYVFIFLCFWGIAESSFGIFFPILLMEQGKNYFSNSMFFSIGMIGEFLSYNIATNLLKKGYIKTGFVLSFLFQILHFVGIIYFKSFILMAIFIFIGGFSFSFIWVFSTAIINMKITGKNSLSFHSYKFIMSNCIGPAVGQFICGIFYENFGTVFMFKVLAFVPFFVLLITCFKRDFK